MARKKSNERLRALMADARWNAGELARAVNALGTVQGLALRYDRTTVAHWLAGSRPDRLVAALVAQALSERIDRFVSVEDTGLARAVQQDRGHWGLHRSSETDTALRLIAVCRDETSPERSGLLTALAYTTRVPPLPDWNEHAAQPRRDSGHRHPTTADIAEHRQIHHEFSERLSGRGGGAGRTALAAYVSDDAAPLITASAPAALHRTVLTTCAMLTHLLAAMTEDTNRQGLAQQYCRYALALAEHAADRDAYAITLQAMSSQALSLGLSRYAATLAQCAVDAGGPDAHPAVRCFLLTQRALTHAVQRDVPEALADLRDAEQLHDQADLSTDPFAAYPRPVLDHQRARVFQALGEPRPAMAAMKGSLRQHPAHQRREIALDHAWLAQMQLSGGHLEAACVHWDRFLVIYPSLRSARADNALQLLLRSLAAFPHQPLAESTRDRARALMRRGPFSAP